MISPAQALLWCLCAGLLWALWKENRRLRAALADTELANEELTLECDAYRSEEAARDAAVERVWLQ